MPDNFSKLWIQPLLNRAAIKRVSEAIQNTGRALPCHVTAVSGSIVTVAFDVKSDPWTLPNVTIPKLESAWIRYPTQVGDKGFTVPADAYLGGVSGLGGGIADLSQPGNMEALVFVPVSNKASPPTDQNAAQISGPNGAIIETEDGSSSIKVDTSGITMSFGGHTVVIDSSGVTIDGILFDTHTHTYTPGTGTPTQSGGPQ